MSMADRAGMRRTAPIFLSHGFRPLFLAAGLWSPAALLLWIVIFIMGGNLPSRFDPLAWHIHEMLFGFVMATIAGFLLTAIPNWTGRPPISGAPLALLASLWLLGPVVCIVSELVPAWFAAMVDLSFSTVLARLVAREILAARNWRNLAMIGALGVFGTANLLMHLEGAGVAVTAGLGWRLGLAAVIVLISVVGGRIMPSFTRSWLAKRRVVHLPAMPGVVDQAALGTLHADLFAWVFLPDQPLVGLLLILGSGFNLWRLFALARRRGTRRATAADPPSRLRMACAGRRVAWSIDALRRSAGDRSNPCADGRCDRDNDARGYDASHARPHRARTVVR